MKKLLLTALIAFSLNAFSQAPVITVSPDFDHYCVDSEISVSIEGLVEPTCNDVVGMDSYCHGENEFTLFSFCPDNPGDGTLMTIEFLEGTIEVGWDLITVFDGADQDAPMFDQLDGEMAGISYTATNEEGCISFLLESDGSVSCESGSEEELVWNVSCDSQLIPYVIQWEPAEFCESPNDLTTEIIGLAEDTDFTVTVYHVDSPNEIAEATVSVTYINNIDLGEDASGQVCIEDEIVSLTSFLNGTPDDQGLWIDEEFNPVSSDFDPMTDNSGIYYYVSEFCPDSSLLDLAVLEIPEIAVTDDFEMNCIGEEISVIFTGDAAQACSQSIGVYSYCYVDFEETLFSYCPDDPGDGTQMSLEFVEGDIETGWDFITVYDGADATAEIIDQFDDDVGGRSYTATNESGCISFTITSDYTVNCEGQGYDPIVWSVECGFSPLDFEVAWSNGEFLEDPNSLSTEITDLSEDTEFLATVYPAGLPSCAASAVVNVTYVNSIDLGDDSDAQICITDETLMLIDLLDGNPQPAGMWLDPYGNEIDGELDPGTDSSGFYIYYHPDCNATTSLFLNIFDLPNISAGEDITACEGETVTLEASGGFGYDWGKIGEGNDIDVVVFGDATYTVTGFGFGGCMASDDVDVFVGPVPGAEITEDNGVLIASDGDSYQWFLNGNQLIGATNQEYTPITEGTYTVEVTNDFGCSTLSDEFVVVSVEELEDFGISLYPNPMSDQAILEFKEGSSVDHIKIQDNSGRLIVDERVSTSPHFINRADLSVGIYVLTIWNDSGDLLKSMKLSVR